MKIRKLFPFSPKPPKKHKRLGFLNQRGQTLVEFVLLLFVITLASLAFIKGANTGIAKYWQSFAMLIVDDRTQNSKLNLQ